MFHDVKQGLAARGCPRAGDTVVVAVSGGADSTALGEVLFEIFGAELDAHVAHLHHGLRGEEADADLQHVAACAERWGWPLHVDRVAVRDLASRDGLSLEAAGRQARHAFLKEVVQRVGAVAALLGHHADDQAETVLANILRGAGRDGLCGISGDRVVDGLRIIRPLLEVTHREACTYLQSRGLGWREDTSNRSEAMLRNRVRHEVLPFLEARVDARCREHLCRLSALMRAEAVWLDDLTSGLLETLRVAGEGGLDLSGWDALPEAAQRAVLRCWLREEGVPARGLSFEVIESVRRLCAVRKGSVRAALPDGWSVARTYDRLEAGRAGQDEHEDAGFCHPLNIPGETRLAREGFVVTATPARGPGGRVRGRLGEFPARASLRREALEGEGLCVRSWRPGDTIAPTGMKGSKKLHDLFIDSKWPRERRLAYPVVATRREVVWVPGYSISRAYSVLSPDERSLRLEVGRIG